jgi:neutral amino acid transport system ATP-binding protein
VSYLLEVHNLDCGYADARVLTDVSVHVADGELVAVIGPNGAGKSTLLKAVAGLLRPSRGQIIFNSRLISGLQAEKIVRLGLSYVPQVENVFPSLTVAENLQIVIPRRTARAEIKAHLEDLWVLFPSLRRRLRTPARNLSGGERQMLALARAVIIRPSVLMLDEPSASLAPNMVDQIFTTITDIHQQGIAVILVEQNAQRALALCDRAYVLEGGTNALAGPGRELLADPRVGALYLGGRQEPRA